MIVDIFSGKNKREDVLKEIIDEKTGLYIYEELSEKHGIQYIKSGTWRFDLVLELCFFYVKTLEEPREIVSSIISQALEKNRLSWAQYNVLCRDFRIKLDKETRYIFLEKRREFLDEMYEVFKKVLARIENGYKYDAPIILFDKMLEQYIC